jgi:dipeptidyl aminopeptidase/acylaminoacyl peptidase
MKLLFSLPVAIVLLASCTPNQTASEEKTSLLEARRGFKTTLVSRKGPKESPEQAPPKIFQTIPYPAPAGNMAAYLSPDPRDGKKHPAIIWITGGDCNSIGDVWSPAPRADDQTAAPFRKAGIIMMFPSLRGGNDNPGLKEGFLGEVDDVLAAADFLEKQEYVDAKRIYLGGHSTGGTLALLVAEASSRFRAVFAYGPVGDVAGYGAESGFLPFDLRNRREVKLRSPGYWLASVQSPVWVLEGARGGSNIASVRAMAKKSTNPKAHFIEVAAADHFTILAPTNELLAQKILQDTGEASNLTLASGEVNQNFAKASR